MANIVVVRPERHANKRWRPQQNCAFAATYAMVLSRDNLDENGGGTQSLKRRPVAKS
jgi:hypothetical protein